MAKACHSTSGSETGGARLENFRCPLWHGKLSLLLQFQKLCLLRAVPVDCGLQKHVLVTATAEVFSKHNVSDAAGGLQPQRCISDETAGTLAALCLDMGLGLTYRSPNRRPQTTPKMLSSLFGYTHNGNPDFWEPPINIQPPTRKPDPCAVVGKNQKELAVRELLGNFFLIAIIRKPQYLQNTRMSSSLNS